MKRFVFFHAAFALTIVSAASAQNSVSHRHCSDSGHDVSKTQVIRSADRKDGITEVFTTPATTDPALQSTLAALADAKRTGSARRVRSLQAELGMNSRGSAAAATQSGPPADWERIVRPGHREPSPRWQNDELVTWPAAPSGKPAMTCQYGGLMYIVVEDLDADYLDIFLSDDGGASWHYTYSISPGGNPSNPSIAFGEGYESNRLLIAYEYERGTPSAAIHLFWEDAETRDYGLYVVASGSLVSRPRLCVDSPDFYHWSPYLTFIRGTITDRSERYDVRFSRSFTMGSSWENPVTVAIDVAETNWPDIDFGDTNLYTTYTRTYSPGDRDTYVRRSTDWGTTWDNEVTLGYSTDDEYDPCVAATNGGGAVVVAYTRKTSPSTSDIDLFYSTTAGDFWNYHFFPGSPAYDAGGVDLCVNSSHGKIHAAFIDGQDIFYTGAENSTPGDWSPLELVNDWHSAAPGERPAIAVNSNRAIEECIAWTDDRSPTTRRVYFDAAYPIGNYVIVLADGGLLDEIDPLIQWKQSLGYKIVTKTVPQIMDQFSGDDPAEQIWAYLNHDYESTRYVLLVGQVDTIPMRLLYLDGNPGDGRGFGSDYYYSMLNTDSWDEDSDGRWGEPFDDTIWLIPDVIVGRVPLSDPQAVAAFAQGVVAAEQSVGAWKQNVLFAHGFYQHLEDVNTRTDAATLAERIAANFLTPNGWTSVHLYEKAGIDTSYYHSDDDLNEENFIRERAPGQVGVVSCAAHGAWPGMLSYIWREDVNHNGYADPKDPHAEYDNNWFNIFGWIGNDATSAVVFQLGCETGVVYEPDPTFAWSGLRSRHLFRTPSGNVSLRAYLAGGAPAAIGSSAGSDYTNTWVDPAEGSSASLSYYFFESLVQQGLRTGDAFAMALVRHVIEHDAQRGARVFNYFGDPTYEVNGGETRRWNSSGLPVEELLSNTSRLSADGAVAARNLPPGYLPAGDGGVFREDDTTWWVSSEIPAAMQVGTIIEAADGSLLAGADTSHEILNHVGGVFRSIDQGESWSPMGELPYCWSVSALLETASGSLMACGLARANDLWYGIIYRSSDGGMNWEIVAALEDAMIFDIAQAPDGAIWACGGWDSWILRSLDDGVSWQALATLGSDTYAYSILPASNGRLFVAMGGPGCPTSLAYSDDGITWQAPIIGADLTGAYDLLELNGLLFAGTRTDVGGAICASDLNGEAWMLVYSIPDPYVRAVRSLCAGPGGYIFAGVDMARGPSETYVYALNPENGLWEIFGGSLDLANYVRTLCATPGLLYAGTGELYGKIYQHILPTGSEVIADETEQPDANRVQVCPNPCLGQAEIRCNLPTQALLLIRIHDTTGRLVRTLENRSDTQQGARITIWDGRDAAGHPLPAGIYLYQAKAGGHTSSGRLILLR
jgi:Peptidase family C25/FlgD Ig-like domain